MKRSLIIGSLSGIGLFTALIVWYGSSDLAVGLITMGWGILLVSAFRFLLISFDMLSWRVLLHPDAKQSPGRLFWIRWVADSANTLLPVARIGGEFIRAYMLYRRKVAGAIAAASVMVDVTVGIFSQLIFSVVGVAAFFAIAGNGENTTLNLTLGLALFSAGLLGFYVVQRAGFFAKLARLTEHMIGGQRWRNLSGATAKFDGAVDTLYRNNRSVALCCFWRIVGWVTGAGEVWLILFFLGHQVSLAEAFILESLGQAARSAGFMIPGGLGVQEGGLILIGSHLGLTPEIALSLSLAKRARELIVGVPCLVAWQVIEGRGLWQRLSNQ